MKAGWSTIWGKRVLRRHSYKLLSAKIQNYKLYIYIYIHICIYIYTILLKTQQCIPFTWIWHAPEWWSAVLLPTRDS